MTIRKRIKVLENRFRDRGPSAEEVSAAWTFVTWRAKAKLRGEPVDEDKRRLHEEVLRRWQEAEGIDLTAEGEAAKARLRNVR